MVNKKAVTLIELIVSITILMILTTIGFLSVRWWTTSARDAVRIDDVKNITTVIDLYHINRWAYPEPTNAVDITHSWATVWTQGGFWEDTIRQVGRIFWELKDPGYEVDYTYSVTNSRKEYQLSYVLEDPIDNLTSAVDFSDVDLIPSAYANSGFSPDEFNPIIWLDATDVDGDGDTSDNPSNNSNLTSWINKSTAWSANNPTLTNGNLKYSTNGFDSNYPWVFIASSRWLRLNNSAISSWDIFYVVQNNDPFNNTDGNGRWLQATSGNYFIWYWRKYRNSLYIDGAPSHFSRSPAEQINRRDPFIYGYHTDNNNYSFRDTWNVVSQWAANSISGRTWAFNRAWASSERADFVVSEILVFSSSLSASEREKVEWYLAHKWWQDNVLPANHPYKNTPPEWWTPPPPPDSTPDVFSLNAITDATLSTNYVSNAITVTWINTSAPITISGWDYSINSTNINSYVNTPWSVNEGDVIRVKQNSSASNSTSTNATLNIGWVADTFTVTTLDGDTDPDSFSFSPVSDAEVNTSYTSNSITVTWINTATPITIAGWDAQYRITTWASYDTATTGVASASSTDALNTPDEAFDNNLTEWWGTNNVLPAWLKYDLGSGNSDTVNKYTIYRSSWQPWYWWASDSPRDWRFEGSNDNNNWTILDTQTDQYITWDTPKQEYSFNNANSYRYYRLYITDSNASDGSDWASITEVELINDGTTPFTDTSWVVNNGDSVTITMTSSSNPGSSETATLNIWWTTETYVITTIDPDTTPDNFSFTDIDDAELSTQYISNNITVSWINTDASISITWAWEYSINGWLYTTSVWTVSSWDTVSIRQTSSPSNSISVNSTLDIWWISATYNVTTPAPPTDTTPDAFVFIDVIDANQSTEYISNSITVSWINDSTSISISGWEYDVNGSRTYTTTASTVNNGDVISVQNISSPLVDETTNATLTIWWISDTYSITTIPADDVPDAFSFDDVSEATLDTLYSSNAITVSWINTSTSINVSDGAYSINGWTYTSAAWTVNNGDIIRVNHTSSTSSTTSVTTTIDIWGISDTYTTTTVLADVSVDPFLFNDIIDAPLSTPRDSEITLSWVNTWVDINISGDWQYSVNGWTYTNAQSRVISWDVIRVRQVSSDQRSDSVNSTVTIWDQSDIFTVTTQAEEPELSNITPREVSNVYVTWNFNGLFSHGVSSTDGNHYVFITPSIITTDTTNTNFLDIINDKKFVFTWYNNYPATYTTVDSNLTQTGWFDQYRISGPIIFNWTREELTSYAGIKQVDNGVRSTYRTTELYRQSAKYLDNYGTWYVEDILWNIIWINPIKPYFCSDILDKEFTENIAEFATITATESTNWSWVSGTWWIANGIISTDGNLDFEYHSDTTNAFIEFEWEEDQPVWFIRIYNRTSCCSARLSGANISLYDGNNTLLYTHTLWDTTNDYVVDLDLEWIGRLYNNVQKIRIQAQWSDSYLNLREVEVFVWGTIEDGFYFVDSDGIWGQRPYEVYCDMTTDGGWWTKIWDNFVINWDFSDGQHALDYPSSTANWNRENNVLLLNNPSWKPYAMRQKAIYGANSNIDYDIVFDDVSSFQTDSELRLSAWVADAWDEWDSENGWRWYIFNNRLTYADGTFVENGERVTLDTQTVDGKLWKYQMVRIPITKDVESFVWQVWNGTEITSNRDFYFADLKAEIYYK